MSNTSVYAFAISEGQANQILDSLGQSGFSSSHISVLFPDKDITHEHSNEKNIKALEGGVIGSAAVGVLGGILGLLVGIGALAIPGMEALIAAGSLPAFLSGAATGATSGGIVGGLIGFMVPDIVAKRFHGRFAEGNILLSVHAETDDEVSRARHVLQRGFADDISTTSIGELAPAVRA